ncbi:MAG: amidohydrolase family protein [Nitrososphaeraceae archaeon]
MYIIFKNISFLKGKELDFIDSGFICISKKGIISRADEMSKFDQIISNKYLLSEKVQIFDGEGLLLIPGFINSHTHVGDSIGKDIGIDLSFNQRIHPLYGIKQKILKFSNPNHLKSFMRTSAISMIKKGTTTFVDFREGEMNGINLLKKSIYDLPIKSIILGRIDCYFNLNKLNSLTNNNNSYNYIPLSKQNLLNTILKSCDGLGLSGANENTNESLKQYMSYVFSYNKIKNPKKKKLIAIHAAESQDTMKYSLNATQKTEIQRIIKFLKPKVIVHATHATSSDLSLISKNNIGIVLCPRANSILGVGIPDLSKILKSGCKIALGTDNVMINPPDILRELEYLWKFSTSNKNTLNIKNFLKMITVNPSEMFNINSGFIESGKQADILFIDKSHIDLQPIHNVYVSIVHRLSSNSIKAIMIDGRFIDEFIF